MNYCKLFLPIMVISFSSSISKVPLRNANLESINTFEVLSGNNYTLNNTKISISNSSDSFLLKDTSSLTNDYHLSFKIDETLTDLSKKYGIILNGTYVDNKLSGDVFKPYYSGNSWRITYGTYSNDVYNQIFDINCDFGSNFNGNYDLYVKDGTLAVRMDKWAIGTIDMVNTEGNAFILAEGIKFTCSNPKVEQLNAGIGNYIYRNHWGGYNHYGYTKCYNINQTHSFTMTIDDSINSIDRLYLCRFAPNRLVGQLAEVTINNIVMSDRFKNSTTNSGMSDQLYEIPLSVIDQTRELNFKIKALESEYCVSGYRLLYEKDGDLYLADSIIINSDISEKAHNYTSEKMGWNGSQYLFVDLKGAKNTTLIGNLKKHKVVTMKAPENYEVNDVNVDLIDNKAIVDFEKQVTMSQCYSYWTEVSLSSNELGTLELNSSVYEFNELAAGTFKITYHINDFDLSYGSDDYVLSASGHYCIGGYIEEEYPYQSVTVETDVYSIKQNNFIRLFNDSASRKFELGTYQKEATLSIDFKGPKVELFGYQGPLGGSFKVEIDGVDKGNFSNYSERERYAKSLFRIGKLTNTTHTVKITTLEDKWYAFDYFEFDLDYETYFGNYNLAQYGKIITSAPNPTGGGNKDLNVIRNEKIYPVGSSNLGPYQYDSFIAPGKENVFYMGYEFDREISVSKLCYQMGCTWNSGGWFRNGTLHLQGLIGDVWTDIEVINDVNYPNSDQRKDFIECSIFYFIFNPITVSGIRIIGEAGGSEHFVSVSQIEVYQNADTVSYCEGYNYRENKII